MSTLSPTGLVGLAIAIGAGVAVALILLPGRSLPRRTTILVGVAMGGLAFQVFHVLEHGLQFGYWLVNPSARPWLTPWAETGAEGLKLWCSLVPVGAASRAAACGAELLHLFGNVIFLAGLLAFAAVISSAGRRSLRRALIVQWFHVAEHVLLTATVFVLGRPLGFSTAFGLLDAGPVASSYRVWFHFLVNLVATLFALAALRRSPLTATRRRRQPVETEAVVTADALTR